MTLDRLEGTVLCAMSGGVSISVVSSTSHFSSRGITNSTPPLLWAYVHECFLQSKSRNEMEKNSTEDIFYYFYYINIIIWHKILKLLHFLYIPLDYDKIDVHTLETWQSCCVTNFDKLDRADQNLSAYKFYSPFSGPPDILARLADRLLPIPASFPTFIWAKSGWLIVKIILSVCILLHTFI